jgi:hypothetical protein
LGILNHAACCAVFSLAGGPSGNNLKWDLVNWHDFVPSNFEYDFERDKLFEHRVGFNEAVECFLTGFEIWRNKKYRDRYQLIGTTIGG